MKTRVYNWEQLQKEDPRQTAVLVTYNWNNKKSHTRVLLKGWLSREEAWTWCQQNDVRSKITYQKGEPFQVSLRLLRMGKVLKWLSAEKPKNVSALRIV